MRSRGTNSGQISLDIPGPQIWIERVADPTRHRVFKKLAVAARFFEDFEIRTAMSDRMIPIVLTAEPQGRTAEFTPALKQRTIDFGGSAAAFAYPPADKVENAQHLLRVHPLVGDVDTSSGTSTRASAGIETSSTNMSAATAKGAPIGAMLKKQKMRSVTWGLASN